MEGQAIPPKPQSSSEGLVSRFYNANNVFSSLLSRMETATSKLNGTSFSETGKSAADVEPDTVEQSFSKQADRLEGLVGTLETLIRGVEAFV